MRLNLEPFKKIARDSQTATAVLRTAYRSFGLANVAGNLTPQTGWTSRLQNPPLITLDELGRTVVVTQDEGPVYLVASGTDKDFTNLGKNAGFPLDGCQQLRVCSQITTEGQARAQLLFLEFDQNRKRVGELKMPGTTNVRGHVLDETAHILPTIRITGVGNTVINWLKMDAITGEPSKSAERITPVDVSASASADSRVAALQSSLQELQFKAAKFSEELIDLPISIHESGTTEHIASSRNDSPISMNRESLIRELLTEIAKSLPTSNGSHHYNPIKGSVGVITDEYMFNFYKDAFEEVHYLSPTNYEHILATKELDAVIYVTCWKGMHNEEWKGVKFRENPASALEAILSYAKKKRIPTIFQSIEDPSNFDYFLPIAEKFDYVFTSDTDMIEAYKEALGHDRVHYGEYGANPRVNNPVGSYRFDFNRAFFAGSYPERYPERLEDMRIMFDAIPDRNKHLTILDRNFNSSGFEFPDQYQPNILGPVPHEVLQSIHKLYRFSLNFNSIKTSPTMCAMRVYELQAQGKPILSNYANSVFNKFPEIRIIAHDTKLSTFDHNEMHWGEKYQAHKLMTELFYNKTSYDVVGKLAENVGLGSAHSRNPKILVVAEGPTEAVRKLVDRQRLVNAEVVDINDIDDADLSDFGYIAPMSSGLDYDPLYLASRLNCFKFTDVLYATQKAKFTDVAFVSGPIHEYTTSVGDRNLTMVSTHHPDAKRFAAGSVANLSGPGYAADPFGINFATYLANLSNARLQKASALSVIIPVYNNGRFLESKCLPSLMRNECWTEMEVLLIDDGSTDQLTIEICEELSARYDNIQFFGFRDGGSGSASRPRNKGVDLASADLVTFIDPDNEISEGGYDNLLKEFTRLDASETPVDLVSGYQVKVASSLKFTGRHVTGGIRLVDDPIADFFARGKFPVISTQAAVIRKSMLQNNGISFIEKAAGQDTLYGWQVLMGARRSAFIDSAHLIYYAERVGSVTNHVDPAYFDKCLKLEKHQVKILEDLNILEKYREHQLENFMLNWYVKKLESVHPERRAEAERTLKEIADLYNFEIDKYLTA